MEKEGKYIYCIIESNQPRSFGPLGIGGRADELYIVCCNGLAACVSNSPIVKYSCLRDNMLAHEMAIEEVMKEYTVLPVRFNTIAEDEEKVKKILEIDHNRFTDAFKIVEGKKELGLKAMFKEEIIYKDILERYKDIRILKEKIATLPSEKTYFQRMEIGRMVEASLQNEREICKKEILDSLIPLAEDNKVNNTYGEIMILSAAFLVNKDKEPEFDQKVQGLGTQYGDKIKFKYVGTLPPFNFVNLVIETGKY
ncbi:MAG: GvpL/GvpF family gas vesicle protein [Bacteroidetes bacterium]|nr:GvpL/GvpF family gas vesicle protein [Bacteroidota bacterium]